MRKTSKLLSLVLAVLMMLSIVSVSASAQYTDVSVDDTALNDAVNLLTTLGVAYGTTETTFAPDENVTRQQMAAFVYRLMKAGKQVTGGNNTSGFTDLDDSTYYYMVSWTADNGIIKGTSATTFNPKGGITLQDAYVMLVRALGYEKDTTLPYPIGFIDVAESIGLDEDLPSTIQYTDTLTRGQVAILLANAFYADMNEVTTKYKWVENKYMEDNTEKSTFAYVPVETTETVASKVFGVVEETVQVVATTHYGFEAEPLYTERQDVDQIVGIRYDEDGERIGGTTATFPIKMKDLGLSGTSDDYFMAELTVFVKKDDSNAVDDKFLAAKSNLIKKTVAASDVVLERSSKTDKEYYVGGVKDKTADKVMTGYITFGTTKAYIDNAPYSYTTVDKKDYVRFIAMNEVSYNDGNATFKYVTTNNFEGDYVKEKNADGKESYEKLTNSFATAFPRIYYNGLYEADVYDVDGDGYAEYVMVKNFDIGEVVVKKNKEYSGLALTNTTSGIEGFYTEKAVITGTYANGDVVLGFFPKNGNTVLKYAEIKEVINPVTAIVTSKTNGDKSQTVTLSTGEVIEFYDADKKFASRNYNFDTLAIGKSYVVYVKGDVLLYKDGISAAGFDADANYAIIIPHVEANNGTPAEYLYAVEGVVNGEFKSYYYVDAIMGGAVKAVKLADYAYAKFEIDDTTGLVRPITDVESVKITKKANAETVIKEIAGKFVTYTVNSDSAYTFTQLGIGMDDSVFSGDEEESVYYCADEIKIEHYTGNIYELKTGVGTMEKFNVKDYSKVIIKTVDDGEDVYTEYTASTLPKFDETVFKNIQAIFVNQKGSTIENLGILYAEIDDFNSNTTKDYRIVTAKSTNYEDGKTVEYLTVLDPKTGTTSVVEAATDNLKVYNIVAMKEDGKAEKATLSSSYTKERIFKAVLTINYDAGNKFLTLDRDPNTYLVDDNTTVLYFTSNNTYEMSDTDILYVGDEAIIDNSPASLNLFVVATDSEESTSTIKIAKTIIVIDPTLTSSELK